MVAVAAFSSLVSNTVTTAAFLPVAIGAAQPGEGAQEQGAAAAGVRVHAGRHDLPVRHLHQPGGVRGAAAAGDDGHRGGGAGAGGPARWRCWASWWWCCWGRCCCPRARARTGVERAGRCATTSRRRCCRADSPLRGQGAGGASPRGWGCASSAWCATARALPAAPTLRAAAGEERLHRRGQARGHPAGEGPAGHRDPPGREAVGRRSCRRKDVVLIEAERAAGQPAGGAQPEGDAVRWSATGWWRWRCTAARPSSGSPSCSCWGASSASSSLSTLPLSVGDVLLLRGPRERVAELADGATLLVLERRGVPAAALRARRCSRWPSSCGALAAGSLGLVPLSVAGLAGMLAMIATGCVDARIAFRVDWRVVLLIGSMMALGAGHGEERGGQVPRRRRWRELGAYRRPAHGAGAADGADHRAVRAHEQPGRGAGGAAGGAQRGARSWAWTRGPSPSA